MTDERSGPCAVRALAMNSVSGSAAVDVWQDEASVALVRSLVVQRGRLWTETLLPVLVRAHVRLQVLDVARYDMQSHIRAAVERLRHERRGRASILAVFIAGEVFQGPRFSRVWTWPADGAEDSTSVRLELYSSVAGPSYSLRGFDADWILYETDVQAQWQSAAVVAVAPEPRTHGGLPERSPSARSFPWLYEGLDPGESL